MKSKLSNSLGELINSPKKINQDFLVKAVTENPLVLKNLKVQNKKVIIAALKKDALTLEFVKHQTLEICLIAVKENGMALKFVKNKTKQIIMAAINQNPHSFQFANFSKEKMEEFIIKDPTCLKSMNFESSDYLISKMINNPKLAEFFPYLKNVTEDQSWKMIKSKVSNIKYIEKQRSKMCLYAVQRSGILLSYCKKQNTIICMTAVNENGLALKYVKQQTPEICLAAILKNKKAYQFVTICDHPNFQETLNNITKMVNKNILKLKLKSLDI